MASISTFSRNFAKGKNGQHSNFRKEFREIWAYPNTSVLWPAGSARRQHARSRTTVCRSSVRGLSLCCVTLCLCVCFFLSIDTLVGPLPSLPGRGILRCSQGRAMVAWACTGGRRVAPYSMTMVGDSRCGPRRLLTEPYAARSSATVIVGGRRPPVAGCTRLPAASRLPWLATLVSQARWPSPALARTVSARSC